jgi:hypothetical protein
MQELSIHNLKQIDQYRWLVPKQGKMRTDGMLFLDRNLLEHIKSFRVLSAAVLQCRTCIRGMVFP